MTTTLPLNPSPWRYTAAYLAVVLVWLGSCWLGWGGAERTGGLLLGQPWDAGLALLAAVPLHGLLLRENRRRREAMQQLREREARWRLAIEGSGDSVWDWQVRTGEAYFSPSFARLLQCEPQGLGGHIDAWRGRIHPDDVMAVEAALHDCLSGRRADYLSEHRLRREDGRHIWVLDRGRVVERDAAGAALRVIGIRKDITRRRELEGILAEQASRYRMLFDENPHPMFVFDTETHAMLAANASALGRFGHDRAALLRKKLEDLLTTEEAGRARLAPRTSVTAMVEAADPCQCRGAGGETLLCEAFSHAVVWQGRPARLVVAHDVTTQHAARAALAESEEMFRAIFRSANDAIIIADDDYIITECNGRGLELFRATREQLVGRRLMGFFPETQPDGSDSRRRARQIMQAVRGGQHAPFEWTHRRPDGSTFVSESTLSSVVLADRRALVVVVRDLTERLRVTAELRLLQAAMQAAPTGLVVTDAAGRIEWVNPAFTRISGYAEEEVIGRSPRLLRSGLHNAEFYRAMWETIQRGEVWSGHVQNRRKDGRIYDEQMTIAPVRAPSGRITHYVALKEDVTNERQLEQHLARVQRLESIGMLASGIAHDLNNVLTPIALSAELLRTKDAPPEMLQRLDIVAQAAQRGAGIVRQVLTFARGVGGERTVVQPRYLIREVAQLAEETFPRQIELRVQAGPGVPDIVGDITQLHTVLLNLAVNARDAMPNGGCLTLGVRAAQVDEARARRLPQLPPGLYVELTVSDTGTGISDDVLEHMFEPFFTTKPRGKGTGLGLATVYGIVRSHGGAVEVATAVGRGTTFTVLLPVPPARVQVTAAPAGRNGVSGAGRLVLVVDDEEMIRITTTQMLRRHGFQVAVACDGMEALQVFRARRGEVAVAVVDMMMPRMGGAALIRELRLLAPDLPVVVSSGFMGEEDGVMPDPATLGVRTLLPKPYGEAELLQALRAELEPARAVAGR